MQILSGSFLTWHDLQTHEKMHVAKEQYVCRFCPSAFVEWGNLVEHENTHTGIKPFKCQLCPLTFFVFSTLRRHERTHENVKQIAKMSRETCPPSHASLSLQSVQERTHTEIQHQNYEECSSDKVMVDKQMDIYIDEKPSKHETSLPGEHESTENEDTQSCQESSENNSYPFEGNAMNKQTESQILKKSSKKDIVLPQEQKQTPLNYDLDFLHDSDKNTVDNQNVIQAGDKLYQCNFCPTSFGAWKCLMTHVSRMHVKLFNIKPFECYFCPREFSKEAALKFHTKSHTGDT